MQDMQNLVKGLMIAFVVLAVLMFGGAWVVGQFGITSKDVEESYQGTVDKLEEKNKQH